MKTIKEVFDELIEQHGRPAVITAAANLLLGWSVEDVRVIKRRLERQEHDLKRLQMMGRELCKIRDGHVEPTHAVS